jgi:cytidylate kinase
MAVVTITRTLGSEGDAIGRALAELLGYRYMDKRSIVQVMRTQGGDVEPTAPEVEEKQPTFWERLNEERRRHSMMLRSAVYGYALDDNCVIVGVGASMLLKGIPHAMKVLTVAPLEARIARVMRSGSLDDPGPTSRESAAEMVRQKDRETSGYLRYLFNVNMMQPHHYDFVLNTGKWDVSQAVEFLASTQRRTDFAQTPAGNARLQNLALASKVEATLVNNAGIWVHGLRVTSERGEVVLTGEVITEEDRDVAEEVAATVPGVRAVVNDLRIQPPPLTGM